MLEHKYITETPLTHRKNFAQFFTPKNVAQLMAKWLLKDRPKTILDPAFGLGVFYEEIKQINPNIYLTGYEIDQHIFNYYNRNNLPNLTIVNNDYLAADIKGYDAIICNPPYMRFQKFSNRHEILPILEKKLAKKLTGYTNIASIFLIKAIKELNIQGRLAFLMPFEFFNTGYGKEIKQILLEENLLKQIVIFNNEKDIFPEVTTTICLLFCQKNGQNEPVKITTIEDNEEINNLDNIENYYQYTLEKNQLPPQQKWTPIMTSLSQEQTIPKNFCQVLTYGSFKRGIATGANEFFALTKEQIKQIELDEINVSKCITKSPLIRKLVFTENDFQELSNQNQPVYCLNVKSENQPSIINYIKQGEKLGLHERYLTKNRKPWYKIETREPAPILFGVFNRGRIKVIRNYSQAINFTCFHGFYPNIFGVENIDKLFIYFLSDQGQTIIKTNKRNYGNNLDKLEPGDINNCFCPNLTQLNLIDNEQVLKIIELAKKDENKAILMSNKLMELIIK